VINETPGLCQCELAVSVTLSFGGKPVVPENLALALRPVGLYLPVNGDERQG